MEESWKQRNFRRLTLEAQSECIKMKQEFNQKILQLEAKLKVSQSELESVKAKQAGEQAALKTALMRGVCALNMETMAVFNETLPNLNKEQMNKKLTIDPHILNEHHHSIDDNLQLDQLTSTKSNGYHLDRSIHNQSEKMIFNIQTDQLVQTTPQSTTEFYDRNRPNSMEEWPRDTLRNLEPSYGIDMIRKGNNYTKPLSHSTEICERWLSHHQSDYRENDSLNLSGVLTCKTPDRHLQTNQSLSDQNELERDNYVEHRSLPNKDLAPSRNYINIHSTKTKHERADRNLYDGKTHTSVENAKKMLSSRNSSNRVCFTTKQQKFSLYPRPQTVEHGIPTGNCPSGSTIMANILVHRHETSNQINSTENMDDNTTQRHTIHSKGIHYTTHCQHNFSSTQPRLYSDFYSHR
ncbi:unnamed protein product [Schistosoma turkestanicum]|nr:unnamed protein product [Schistosoma turkestanicum]